MVRMKTAVPFVFGLVLMIIFISKSFILSPAVAIDNGGITHAHAPAKRVLIFTTYRSGSSFLGQLFQQNTNFSYLFEPLRILHLNEDVIHRQKIQDNLPFLLKHIYECDFKTIESISQQQYSTFSKNYIMFWHWRIYQQLYEKIGINHYQQLKDIKVDRLIDVCKRSAHHAIKIIRGDSLKTLFTPPINDENQLDLRVIYLVRDPRGNEYSRLKVSFIKSDYKSETDYITSLDENKWATTAGYHCKMLTENAKFLQQLTKNGNVDIRKNILFIRYEDLAYEPLIVSQQIYSFLNLKMPKKVEEYVRYATSLASDNLHTNVYDTRRNSTETAEAWRLHLPISMAKALDKECKETMELLGYNPVTDERTYTDRSISLVGPKPIL